MNKRFHRATLLILLITVMAACASPIIQPSSSEEVATGLPQTSEAATIEPGDMPEASSNLLPRSLYFLGIDGGGTRQVYRMERDGKMITQLTFESVDVSAYDVALLDGRIAYGAGNQLILSDANGSNRQVLVDGRAGPDAQGFSSLAFSPNGKTLAYASEGLNLYDVSTGVSSLAPQSAFARPVKFSPDSTKLLVTVSPPNTDAAHDEIYFPA
ncbi:MAG TPA: WD40 repeat domain-containing protein, partial [Anaerolineales bacterium]|nr:WD40 repeat domain-containing protein [Anaerolineales bacterium]